MDAGVVVELYKTSLRRPDRMAAGKGGCPFKGDLAQHGRFLKLSTLPSLAHPYAFLCILFFLFCADASLRRKTRFSRGN